jgi:hypothetical protein
MTCPSTARTGRIPLAEGAVRSGEGSMSVWSRASRISRLTLRFLLMMLVAFVLLEGLSSVFLFGYDLDFRTGAGLRSRQHVEYSEELGWVNRPNLTIDDFYAPGAGVRTNSQSFRNDETIAPEVPEGKVRIVCMGDSFTFGIGVDNEHTWPGTLSSLESRLQSVNLGEAGYGIDQAYLKYLLTTADLEYDAVVFAFIHDNFVRMQKPMFCNYYKPILQLNDDQLVTTNVPVPAPRRLSIWLNKRYAAIHGLRTVQLGGKVARRVLPSPEAVAEKEYDVIGVSMKIFSEVDRLCREKNATALFVYLQQDRFPLFHALEWGAVLEREFESRGLAYLNLASETQLASPAETGEVFDPRHRHYSVEGNRFVARRILDRLRKLPEFSRKLDAAK